MGNHHRSHRRRSSHHNEPFAAKAALVILLLNVFLWVGLRNLDIVVVSFCAALLALVGFITAHRARRWSRRHNRAGEEDSMAVIAFWGNAILLLGSTLVFAYQFAIGVLRGDFL